MFYFYIIVLGEHSLNLGFSDSVTLNSPNQNKIENFKFFSLYYLDSFNEISRVIKLITWSTIQQFSQKHIPKCSEMKLLCNRIKTDCQFWQIELVAYSGSYLNSTPPPILKYLKIDQFRGDDDRLLFCPFCNQQIQNACLICCATACEMMAHVLLKAMLVLIADKMSLCLGCML